MSTIQPSLNGPPLIDSDGSRRFQELQAQLTSQFKRVFPHSLMPRTVVVIPSLSLDAEELTKISGAYYYEERMLCLLMLLRMPRAHVVYVTSQPIHSTIIDYYLHLLPGIPVSHARKRLTLLSCHDGSPKSLTEKILARPRLIKRIQEVVAKSEAAHMTCFNATISEQILSLKLDIPLYAANPALAPLGSKSGSRKIFRKAGILLPDGFEDLKGKDEIVDALLALKKKNPAMKRAVVKLNEGFSGEGNALFSYAGSGSDISREWIADNLPERIKFEAALETWESFDSKFSEMGGIVEAFIEGQHKESPSVQCRIDPIGEVKTISTHDQVLGGPSKQVFQGCTFPANAAYRMEIQEAGERVAHALKEYGVIGRFGIDFISIRQEDKWVHYAIEINLRKGGTTHPFMMLQFLTDGEYDRKTGRYLTSDGIPRFYRASDNLQLRNHQGLTPDDLIDISVYHDLHFHSATQQGVMFHLIGALSEFGKLGVVCIGDSPVNAQALYDHTVNVLKREGSNEAHDLIV